MAAVTDWLSTCDLCLRQGGFIRLASGNAESDPLLSSVGMRGDCATVGCPSCGWVFKPRVLSKGELEKLYDERGGMATVDAASSEQTGLRSQELYTLLVPLFPKSGNLRVLDVGGGAGQACSAFANRGHEVHILDLAATEPVDSRMFIHRGTLASMNSDITYDLIMMNHVLEHVWSPRDLLNAARARLNPQGRLFVEVPFELYTPFVKRRLGDARHVGYFAVRTLRRFLLETGYTIHWIRRVLAPYDRRRVMAIRALASVATKHDGQISQLRLLPGLLGTALEMASPRQLLLALLRTR